MCAPLTSVIYSGLIELVKTHIVLTISPIATTHRVWRKQFTSIRITMVITLLNSCKSIYFQTWNRFDINSSLERTTEIVTVLVRLTIHQTLNRVILTTIRYKIITIRRSLIIDWHSRIKKRCLSIISSRIVIAVVHV